MIQRSSCEFCTALKRHLTDGIKSSFEQQLILDHYDGTLTGILKCATCETAYHCKIIDWTSKHDKRVFALGALPGGTFEQIVELFVKKGHSPNWPIWAPHINAEEGRRAGLGAEMKRLLAAAGSRDLLIAADSYIKHLLALRLADPAAIEDIEKSTTDGFPTPVRNWFEYLGLERK
jgi:hypothetical protein